MEWENRVALITGASGGIGSSLAGELASRGVSLFLVDIKREALESQVRQLGEQRAAWAAVDVTSKAEVSQAVEACLGAFGRIDFLVNLAGVFGRFTPTIDIAEEEWDRLIDINLKGVFLFCQAVLPHMVERRSGHIVNMSSDLARRGGVGSLPYICAKAGIMGLTRALSLEFASQGISINSIAPAIVDTPLSRGAMSDEAMARAGQANPSGRLALPADVSNAVLFLLQDESQYINGQTIFLNGGLL
ncbi:MAG TPA: SDR family NAD(P)-dependent oxidoreductase [Dehalococcoidia bacterium]|nr:SDR family NAD(P)-dependent oxidoreductase [Dehalococcoidia bacterium]